ncbi:hypothetical protein OG426_25075 [Streptomyces canus]|uniref:hypothetical protein n=1 Tax=Streptomyces canus TaxID=58343 RepID=UPI00386F8806|nr:hypothetical protein OG426_25075 [Streptomyces canus]
MMSRIREFRLPSGVVLETPLMVPSLSSRGFDLQENGLSETSLYLQAVQEHLTESLLVSAYDLHYRIMPQAREFLSDLHWETIWATPTLLVVDSGGYELGNVWDGAEVRRGERPPRKFQKEDYRQLVGMLPRDRDLLVVTWDHVAQEGDQLSLEEQIREAGQFCAENPDFMVDFLLKPEQGERFIDAERVRECCSDMANFDVIGVTEKELGDSIFDRVFNLLKLRRILDDAQVDRPIHIFGALDPLFIRLYFMCGAEIFDGLTWLRYGIFQGVTVYKEAAALLSGDFDRDESGRLTRQQIGYLRELRALKRELKGVAEVQRGAQDFEVTERSVIDVLNEINVGPQARGVGNGW